MENVNDKNRKLIKALELIGDYELMKPIDEIDGDLIDATVDWSLRLQNKDITLSTEEIEKMVSMIPFDDDTEELETNGEAFESRKVLKKNKVLFIAAVITILVTLLTIISVAFEWNIFEELKNRFGSVADTPVNEEIVVDGETVIMLGEFEKYKTIEDVLYENGYNVLYPINLPVDVILERITIYQENAEKKLIFNYNDKITFFEVTFNKGITQDIINVSQQRIVINEKLCYFVNITDLECSQAYFEFNNDLYSISCKTQEDLIEVIKNLKELE